MNKQSIAYHARHRWHLAVAWILIAVSATILYWPGTSGPFIFDDIPNISDQEAVHADSVTWSSLQDAAGAFSSRFTGGRPLPTITFAIDHARAGGLDTRAFKQTNLLVHAANALLVLILVHQLLAFSQSVPGRLTSALETRSEHLLFWAFAITILWAIHPLQVSTVLYVVQRMEMLAATFTLLALISYGHGRQRQIQGRPAGWLFLGGSALLAGTGLLAKETAALFFAFAFFLELTLLRFRTQTSSASTILKAIFALVFLTGLVIFIAVLIPTYTSPDAFQGRDFTWQERLLTQLRVLPLYLSQILLPLVDRMPFYYDAYPVSTGLFRPVTTFLGGLLIVGLLTLAFWLRHKAPLLALGILWFFAAHFLTSNLFNLELVFEHRNYFAILPVLIALTYLVSCLPLASIRPRLIGIAVVALFAFLTLIRSATWGDPLNLAMHHVAINPDSERAQLDIGIIYGGMSDANPNSPFYQFAVNAFENAAELPYSSPIPEHALILLATTAGTEPRSDWWRSFIDKLENRPLGAQSQRAVRSLIMARLDSLPIDDRWIATVYHTIAKREETRAALLMPFGSYAIQFGESRLDAAEVLKEVARTGADDPEQLQGWAQQLIDAGFPDAASILID